MYSPFANLQSTTEIVEGILASERIPYKHLMKNSRIDSDNEMKGFFYQYHLRDVYLKYIGFSIITDITVNAIHKNIGKNFTEFGSGMGYLANKLEKLGSKGILIDPMEKNWVTKKIYREPDHKMTTKEYFFRSNKISTKDVIMIWPYMEEWCDEVLEKMETGQRIFYCGEFDGGCCATEKFFRMLKDEFEEITDIEIPSIKFNSIHDYWSVWEKK